jgi:hypothetical protein
MYMLRNWVLVLLVLPFLSCPGREPAAWSNLRQLDELCERAEQLMAKDDHTALRVLRPDLVTKARQVADDPLPAHAPQVKQAGALQDDLRALAKELNAPELSNESLKELCEGLHPIVARLLEAAGLPHVHEDHDQDDETHHHDHDHEHGHDHDHEHHEVENKRSTESP